MCLSKRDFSFIPTLQQLIKNILEDNVIVQLYALKYTSMSYTYYLYSKLLVDSAIVKQEMKIRLLRWDL